MSSSHPPPILARYPLQALLAQNCELPPITTQRLGPSLTHECSSQRWTQKLACPSCLALLTLCYHFVYSISSSKFLHRIPLLSVPPRPRNNASPKFRACPRMNKSASRLVVPRRARNKRYKQRFPLSKTWCVLQMYPFGVSCITRSLSLPIVVRILHACIFLWKYSPASWFVSFSKTDIVFPHVTNREEHSTHLACFLISLISSKIAVLHRRNVPFTKKPKCGSEILQFQKP